MPEEKERRSHERVAAAVRLIVKKSGDETPLLTSETESLDVSEGGILLNSDFLWPEGLEVNVEMHLSESLQLNANWPKIQKDFPDEIVLPGKIVRCQGASEIGYVVAVSFDEPNKKKLKTLAEFISQVDNC